MPRASTPTDLTAAIATEVRMAMESRAQPVLPFLRHHMPLQRFRNACAALACAVGKRRATMALIVPMVRRYRLCKIFWEVRLASPFTRNHFLWALLPQISVEVPLPPHCRLLSAISWTSTVSCIPLQAPNPRWFLMRISLYGTALHRAGRVSMIQSRVPLALLVRRSS